MTRLSRKAIAGLLGVSAVVVMAGTLWALRPMERKSSPDELYSIEHRVVAEGVSRLPRDYAGLVDAAGVPKLGPPLPGDLGLPIVAAQADGRMAAGATPPMGPSVPGATAVADQALERRLKAAQDAVGSPLFSVSDRGRAAPATDGETAGAGPSLVIPTAEASSPAGPAPSRHEAFANTTSDLQSVSVHRLEAPASPYSVLAGTVISAALLTGLNSDLPGQVIATVTTPVFDSLTGRTLLVPQGARLLGSYDSDTGFGESRAMVVWTRLLLPDGRSLVLDRLTSVDPQGYAGISDRVDHRWRRLAGGALISSLLGVGAELIAPQSSGAGVVVAVRDAAQGSLNQIGQELTRRNLDIKPTLKVRPGHTLRVLVTRDLPFAPYPTDIAPP